MFKKVKKYGIIFIILSLSIFLYSCTNNTKKVTLSENTREDILLEEDEIAESINTAKKLLSDNQFTEANDLYNKALSLDNTNKDLYIEIKDNLLNSNRYEDAYNVVKKAIDNNIDVDNMKKIANDIARDIASNFQTIQVNYSIYDSSSFTLPSTITTTLDNNEVTLNVAWDNSSVNTKKIGEYSYKGFSEEHFRNIEAKVNILNRKEKVIGSIKNIYTSNGKTYIDVDLVEFYFGKELALQEAMKDNNKIVYDEEKGPYVPDGYYIRNNYNTITTYEVSDNCNYKLLEHDLEERLGYEIDNKGTSDINFDCSAKDFKEVIKLYNEFEKEELDDNGKPITNRSTLCWIELDAGIAQSIYRQYTP